MKRLLAQAKVDQKAGNLAAAIEALQQAACLDPSDPGLLMRLGNLHLRNRFNAPDQIAEMHSAVGCFRGAVALKPLDPDAYTWLGDGLIAVADAYGLDGADQEADANLDEAIASYRAALKLGARDDAELALRLATALVWGGQFDDALSAYRQSLKARPSAEAWYGLGRLVAQMGRPAESIDYYDRALAIGSSRAAVEKTLSLLLLGEIDKAWAHHQKHFEAPRADDQQAPPETPIWRGSNISEQRILVSAGGGIGDEVRMTTCYADLIALSGECHILCEPRLERLLRRSFPRARWHPVSRGFPQKLRVDPTPELPADFWERMPRFDCCYKAELLPSRLRRSFESFRREQAHCLLADPAQQALWEGRLRALGPGWKVGLCWRSGLTGLSRRVEYTRLDEWLPVLSVPGVQFVNLHYKGDEEIEALSRRTPTVVHRWTDLDLRDDLDNVAALITQLDLVISAATLIAELAGALGVTTWRVINTRIPSNLWRVFPGTNQDVWHPRMIQMNGEPIGDTPALMRTIAAALMDVRRAGETRLQGSPV